MKSQKDRIRQAAKVQFPANEYNDEYYGDIPKQLEQPAFKKGATWAIQNEGLRLLKFIEDNIFHKNSNGVWRDRNDTLYTEEEVIECFMKSKLKL